MSASQLLRWQWEGYPRYHRSRFNLLLHIAAVPMFLVGNVALVVALVQRSWHIGIAAVVAMVGSALGQCPRDAGEKGLGMDRIHRREEDVGKN